MSEINEEKVISQIKIPNIGKKNINKVIGGMIRTLRKKHKMSQQALAQKIGVSFQQVQKYELGISRLSLEKYIQIQTAFGERIFVLTEKDYEILDTIKELQKSETLKNVLKKLNFIQ